MGRKSKLELESGVYTGTACHPRDEGWYRHKSHTEVLSSRFEDKKAQKGGGAEKAEGGPPNLEQSGASRLSPVCVSTETEG